MRLGILVTATASTSYAAARPVPFGGQQRRPLRTFCRATHGGQGQDSGFPGPSEASRAGAAPQEGQAQQVQQDGVAPARRPRGRPPGHPAWNKGVPMPESTRKELSRKLKQKWKDPEYRRTVTEAMQGKEPWNRGLPHGEETVRKMAEAKLGKRRSPATRRLMAQAHLGSGHLGEEARAEVGDRFRGQPKTPEHRLKLAAVARRRHAATRVLRAVEAVYSAAGASNPGSSGGTGGVAPANSMGGNMGGGGNGSVSAPSSGSSTGGGGSAGGNMGAVRASAYSMGLTGLSAGSGKRLSRTQILNTFKSELREYRLLQEELSTWTAAFVEKHNRKPSLVDVQRTGIPWLIERFKQYVVLRDRLFSDTSVLRGKLQESIPDPDSVRNANGGGGGGGAGLGPINANGPNSGERGAMASRFATVMEYKLKRQQAGGPGVAAGSAAEAASPSSSAEQDAGEAPPPRVNLGSQAPPRVRLAMQAALEYRQGKAQATKAAADAAAASARPARSAPLSISSGGGGMGLTSALPFSSRPAAAVAAAAAPAAAAPEAAESEEAAAAVTAVEAAAAAAAIT